MSIAKTDIKLMGSERLTDFYDGGGEMTGAEIVDGEVNNLFPDISRLDRVYGRVSLRKAFAAVLTGNTDMYYGSHAIITQPPADNNVHTTLFSTNDFYDVRDDAKDRVESYVSIAQELILRPLNDQLEGQRAITCFQTTGTSLPVVGKTIALLDSSNGFVQYVRIMDVSVEPLEFYEDSNYTQVDVVTMNLSAPLQATFPGIAATRHTTKATTRIHATVVADAAKYYGVKSLAQAAIQGDLSFWAESIYNQLVPTSQLETPIIDQLMGGSSSTMVMSGAADSLVGTANLTDAAQTLHLLRGILPGSLSVTIGGYGFTDAGGSLVATTADGGHSGTVDYAQGMITISKAGSWGATATATATPAAAVGGALYSSETVISLESRAFNYVPNLYPLPHPGSLVISYMAQGSWYRLTDNGRGVLVPDVINTGTGTVDYVTGTVLLTVGALPDVGSSIIYQWGSGDFTANRAGELDTQPLVVTHTLANRNISPGSLAISWDSYSLTDNGDGTLTGDGVGSISYVAGVIRFTPTAIPASGTTYSVTYSDKDSAGGALPETPSFVQTGANVDLTLATTPIRPGSVKLSLAMDIITESYNGSNKIISKFLDVHDDGLGLLKNYYGGAFGTVDYATGAVHISGIATRSYLAGIFVDATPIQMQHVQYARVFYTPNVTDVTTTVELDAATTWTPQVDALTGPPLVFDLLPDTADKVAPGSVAIAVGGAVYYDDGSGQLYYAQSALTGAGTLAGSVDYDSGLLTLTTYPAMADPAATVLALLSQTNQAPLRKFIFRTPGVPVREGSLSLRGTTFTGTAVSAIAGTDGVIADAGVAGTIDVTLGIVRLDFSAGVVPATALYNCVVYSFLPLDASLLGIEPIRLPLDGRVPIFKSGDVAVVHHTADEALPDNLAAGQVVNLSRGALALCDIRDQAGTLLPETLYTIDLDTGIVTLADPLDLSAYTQPLIAATRIEDMVLISEAQINGLIRTVGPLTHSYPATETQVSSALIFGDLAARSVRSYTQKTWDSIWRDTRNGDDTSAKYNDLTYPLVLTNQGSIAGRWCIKFTGATTFDVISENMGIIASGTTSSDVAPINPASGVPYFRIDYRGWGSGWASGNCLRFDTSAANAPLWLARTTMQGAVEAPTDNFVIQIRGDAN